MKELRTMGHLKGKGKKKEEETKKKENGKG